MHPEHWEGDAMKCWHQSVSYSAECILTLLVKEHAVDPYFIPKQGGHFLAEDKNGLIADILGTTVFGKIWGTRPPFICTWDKALMLQRHALLSQCACMIWKESWRRKVYQSFIEVPHVEFNRLKVWCRPLFAYSRWDGAYSWPNIHSKHGGHFWWRTEMAS